MCEARRGGARLILPDLDLARRFLLAAAPPGRVVLCAITGSHAYGFPSRDSDLDIKGIHLAPAADLLGLSPPPPAFERLETFEGTECDLSSHEARQAFTLLLRGNGNVLERIFSPFQLAPSPEVDEVRVLARGVLSRRVFDHYRGFFGGVRREAERGGLEAKPLLYAYRVALTGVHLLRTGEVVQDLTELAPRYGFCDAVDLAEAKALRGEHGAVTAAEHAFHRSTWPQLEEMLVAARAESVLPESPPDAAALSAWLVARARAELAGSDRRGS